MRNPLLSASEAYDFAIVSTSAGASSAAAFAAAAAAIVAAAAAAAFHLTGILCNVVVHDNEVDMQYLIHIMQTLSPGG